MFEKLNIKKQLAKRRQAKADKRAQEVQATKDRWQGRLDAALKEPTAELRYLRLINCRTELRSARMDLDMDAENRRRKECTKSGLLYATPLAAGLICLEPVSWSLTLAAVGKTLWTGVIAYTPAPIISSELQKSSFGKKKVMAAMAADYALIDHYAAAAETALADIEEKNIAELAKSKSFEDMLRWRPELKIAVARAFAEAAQQEKPDAPEKTVAKPLITPPRRDGFGL
ncbi:MAG: hypothetical protein GC185_03715 [Alphaproteobacteria bacterium]|nr:hypothetical protein [Alphaproteobacteria bacterium]